MTFQTNFPLYPTKLPYVTVSAKGMSNGLSDIPNDGFDFGPDTMLNTSSPDQYGPPYTQSMGLQEAWNYALANPINYSPASSLYYVPEIHFVGGAYDIYAPVTINPPVYVHGETNVNGNNNYTIGNIIMKGQGSMNPYLINHVTSDYMINVIPDNVINTNIQIDNLQLVSAIGTLAYGHINLNFASNGKFIGANIFQSINLDVNLGTSQPPLNIIGVTSILLWNYEMYGNQSSTYPSSVFVASIVFSAQSCNFNGEQIYAQDLVNISGSLINPAQSSEYGLIFPSGYNSNKPIAKVVISNSYISFPIQIGLQIDDFEISSSTLNWDSGTSYLLQAVSGTSPIIVKLRMKNNALTGTGETTPAISTGITVYDYDLDEVTGNIGNYFPHDFSVNGTTSGQVLGHYVTYTANYKKLRLMFSAYENDTTTNQTINYPLPFSVIAVITTNNTPLTLSTSNTGLTITTPNNTNTYFGLVIIEGY